MVNGKNKNKKMSAGKARKARAGVARTPRASAGRNGGGAFGAVSTITTAPVSIGNSLRGSQPVVLHTADGCTVMGRDFGFSPIATGDETNWCHAGGMPLTPACMPSTALRNFCQMYNKFKFNRSFFHYITSSATTTTGDIVFQHMKDSASSPPEWTNTSFLPFILSDPLTVIGPQWTNHTCEVNPKGSWKSTDYGVTLPNNQYSFGDLFLYTKTTSTDSPGYIIFDYNISFAELSVNPRAGIIPFAKAQWAPVGLTIAGSYTAATTNVTGAPSASGIGGTTISAQSFTIGDVYKFAVDATNTTYSGANVSNFFNYTVGLNTGETFTLKDGICLYLVASASNIVYFFQNETDAFAAGLTLKAGVTATYAETIRGMIKYIGSVNPAQLAGSY